MAVVSTPSPPRNPPRFTRRTLLAGAAALSAGLIIDAGEIDRHTFDIVHRTISIRRLPPAFHGYRIVQISDIHLEEYTESWFLRLAIRQVNRLAPDLVLLTGDFASHGPLSLAVSRRALVHCAELLHEIACPVRYAVLGNHDTRISSRLAIDSLAASNIPVLVNRYVPLERNGQRIWLGGTDDAGTSVPILDLAVPRTPDAPVLLMVHEPDFADVVVRHPRYPLVDLMLSGHSHGGQIRLPFVGPLVLPPMGGKYVEGLFRFGSMQLYVNRGLGTVGLPLRFNCPPEITVLTLQPDLSTPKTI